MCGANAQRFQPARRDGQCLDHSGVRMFSKKSHHDKDMMIGLLVEYYKNHSIMPPQKYELEVGGSMVKLGRFLTNVKHGNTKLSVEQLGRLLEADPHVMETKTMPKDQRIDALIAFYHQNGRWPKQGEADPLTARLRLGLFLNNIKQGRTRLTLEQRDRLLSVDPDVLDAKPISKASKHISEAAKTMTMDQKVDSLIAFYNQHGKWPQRDHVDLASGLATGVLLSNIKHGNTRLTEEHRDRLLAVDPRVLDTKPITHAAKNLSKDQKVDRLIAFFYQRGRWPIYKEVDPDTGLPFGAFLHHVKQRYTRLTEEQRGRLLALDPRVLNVRQSNSQAANRQ